MRQHGSTNPPQKPAGVTANRTITAPGLVVLDGTVDDTLNTNAIDIALNGIIKGKTTATNIRVAGRLMNTYTAHQSRLIESTEEVTGYMTYGNLEIKKVPQTRGARGLIG